MTGIQASEPRHSYRYKSFDLLFILNSILNRLDIYFIKHPTYNSNNAYDIALIKLASPVTLSDTIQPVCLPGNRVTNENDHVIVTGWVRLVDRFTVIIKWLTFQFKIGSNF